MSDRAGGGWKLMIALCVKVHIPFWSVVLKKKKKKQTKDKIILLLIQGETLCVNVIRFGSNLLNTTTWIIKREKQH